ncbi:MAG TPA: transposase, partial [Blastocatellia bacterium]|nr:transposase [Blastocatellia bacterium]
MTTVETVETVKLRYKQVWSAYNCAQVNEKARFLVLLYELCQGIDEPIQIMGRTRLPLRDMIFSAVYKVYSTVSSRRFMSDLKNAWVKGYIETPELQLNQSLSRHARTRNVLAMA